MGITLLTGQQALARAAGGAFQSAWKALYARCPWATACQHPDFVLTWYHFYQPDFVPVMVFDEDGEPDGGRREDGAVVLSGLLTLALHAGGARLSGAGDNQAEYQGWLQPPGAGAGFMLEALRALRRAFPAADLCLRYLPPGIELGAFQPPGPAGPLGALVSLREYRRPLMHIEASAMQRQRNKKNHRQNTNRLGRIGAVRFERLTGHERFIEIFDDMCLQYDFRQASLYRTMPFAHDPAKKPFTIELHKKGLLHVSILTVGETLAAAHIGLLSAGRAVHLGITSHDPALAAHSPGNLLLAMLGVHLAAENIPWLDLTPGGDRYKEHFATDHDVVFALTVYGNRRRRWRHEASLAGLGLLKNAVQRAGWRPADLLAFMQKCTPARYARVQALDAAWRRRARPGIFRHGGKLQHIIKTNLAVSRNSLHDLMKYDALGSLSRYREFMSVASKRMERSCDLYSHIRHGKLQICCWAQAAPGGGARDDDPSDTDTDTAAAADAIVLSDLYVHRDLQHESLVGDFLAQMVSDLRQRRAGASIYYRGVLDEALRRVMQACGFVEQRN